jgi:hypothetical protein
LLLFHNEIQQRMIPLWKKGFIPSAFVSVFEHEYASIPRIRRWILYIEILRLLRVPERV